MEIAGVRLVYVLDIELRLSVGKASTGSPGLLPQPTGNCILKVGVSPAYVKYLLTVHNLRKCRQRNRQILLLIKR